MKKLILTILITTALFAFEIRDSESGIKPDTIERLQNGILYRTDIHTAQVETEEGMVEMYEYTEHWIPKNASGKEIQKTFEDAPPGLIGFLKGNRPPDPDWSMDIKQVWLENIGISKQNIEKMNETEVNSMINNMKEKEIKHEWRKDGNYKYKKSK